MSKDALRLDAFMPYRLSIASNAVSKAIASAYAKRFGLSIPEWRLIAVLTESEPATQQELVGKTLMDKVAVSRAAQALEERALIHRAEDDTDGRARRLSLTPAGRALYKRIAPAALRYEAQLLAAFDPREITALRDMLERLTQAAAALEEDNERKR